MKEKNAIVCSNLTLGYDAKPIVKNICFTILSSEFIAILGQNGSGKSTFLKTILGLLKPIQGSIKVMDKEPSRGNPHIGYMPQVHFIPSIFNLSGYAMLAATILGTGFGIPLLNQHQKDELNHIIHLVHAAPFIMRPLAQLSGGERQRIYLAQAVLGYPKILLLDEPLANLDPAAQEIFIKILKDIKEKFGTTILFTAHDPNTVVKVMDKVLYFAKGNAILGNVSQVITSETLSALYGTPIEVIEINKRLIVIGEDYNLEGTNHHYE